ncbi:threonine aldolase family protein [Frigidibacter sp. MR17.24]|uniref:threonine aldolase family protein n=1 Tax=Frigidibacter sp. MR17.24 TaxID=3127345 RepID=UPI003012F1C9
MFFASDNSSPAAPQVMAALAAANEGYAMPYGRDAIMDRVRARIREIFEAPEAAVYLVATGTAANSLSLAILCQPWQGVFCHRNAHVEEDECGAPEFFIGGGKMVLVEGEHAKMTPDALRRQIQFTGRGGIHNIQRGAVSITNATEHGTVYFPGEIRKLTAVAREFGLPVHMDGARFTNALVATGASAADMTWRAGVDVLSFGGTKNGCAGVEAVVIFDPKRAQEFEFRRKRGGHLFSKHRYLSAQMDAYLTDGLWLDLARRANAAAGRLSTGILQVPGTKLVHPTEANAVFAAFPRAAHRRAQDAGAAYYLWPGDQPLDGPDAEPLAARMVCSWSTTAEDIDRFLGLVRG